MIFRGESVDADGRIAAQWWQIGDSRPDTGASTRAHVFGQPGRYIATYTAVDDSGARSVPSSRVVTVGTPSPPGANFALRFHGNGVDDIDRVKIQVYDPSSERDDPPADIGGTDFTIEFWMQAAPGENRTGPVECGRNHAWIFGNILLDRDRWNFGRKFGMSMAGGRMVASVTARRNESLTICGQTRVDDGRWHHVAFTRRLRDGALQLFIDGVLDAAASSGPAGDISYPPDGAPGPYCAIGPCTQSDPFLVLGAEKHDAGPDYPAFSGTLDELRLSTVVRYLAPFEPPRSRFEPDDATAALYHFDEGAGHYIGDTSGAPGGPSYGVRRYGGNPPGPEWVESTAPTGR